MDIAAWLRELGLERYEQAFRDNDVDAKVLPHLTAEISRTSASPRSAIGGASWPRSRRSEQKPRPPNQKNRQRTRRQPLSHGATLSGGS